MIRCTCNIMWVLFLVVFHAVCTAHATEDSLRAEIQQMLTFADELGDRNVVTSIDSAIKLLDSAAVLVKQHFGPEDSLLAETYYRLAVCHVWASDFTEGEAHANEAITIWEQLFGPTDSRILLPLNTLETSGLRRHDLTLVAQVNERRFAIINADGGPTTTEEWEQLVDALNDRGRLHTLHGRFDDARTDFEHALSLITEDMEDGAKLRAGLVGNLGWLSGYEGNYRESIAYIMRADALIKEAYGPKHPLVLNSLAFLAESHRNLGEYAQADSLIDLALDLTREIHGPRSTVFSDLWQTKSKILVAQGKVEEAVAVAQQAVDVNKAISSYPTNQLMSTLDNLGRLSRCAGNTQLANTTFQELVEARQSSLNTVFRYASESRMLSYIRTYPPIVSSYVAMAVEEEDTSIRQAALGMVLSGKGLAVDAMAAEYAAAACSSDPEVADLLTTHKSVCNKIAKLSVSPRGPDTLTARYLGQLYEEKTALETKLSQACFGLDFSRKSIDEVVASVAAALPENTLLLEFVRYDRTHLGSDECEPDSDVAAYALFTLTPDGLVSVSDVADAAVLDSLVRQYQQAMSAALHQHATGQYTNTYPQLASDLYDHIVRPWREAHPSAERIFVAADGLLNLVPFETLIDDKGRYLIEDLEFAYLTSGRDLIIDQIAIDAFDIVIMADPDYMSHPQLMARIESSSGERLFATRDSRGTPECLSSMFAPLPMTAQEGKNISDLFEKDDLWTVFYYTSSGACEEVLKDLKHTPGILHLATHGYFCAEADQQSLSNPLLRSGLILAGANQTIGGMDGGTEMREDGILTALEMSGLKLFGTQLVVLSACQTGIGDVVSGEGVFGLRRALKHAGVRKTIMSMFEVSDETTSELMTSFYSRWLTTDETISSALRAASLDLLRDRMASGESTHPVYWGGFILVGEPNWR